MDFPLFVKTPRGLPRLRSRATPAFMSLPTVPYRDGRAFTRGVIVTRASSIAFG